MQEIRPRSGVDEKEKFRVHQMSPVLGSQF
jgi:hypothetical protein